MRCRVGGESVTGGGAEPFFSSLQTGGVSFSFALRCFLNGGATSRSLFEAGPCALIRGCAAAEARKERERQRARRRGAKQALRWCEMEFFFFPHFFFNLDLLLASLSRRAKPLSPSASLRAPILPLKLSLTEKESLVGAGGVKKERKEKRTSPPYPRFSSPFLPTSLIPTLSPPSKKKKSSASSSSCRARARSASASGTSPRRPASARA